ncbi:MAG: M48 family metallopeptidase [Muribaculaceae bacterium]|nr:M48 family metallopeptidase [Muribaculaceae bacterium]
MGNYVGIQTQQSRNNLRSTLLLIGFPLIILFMTWVGIAIVQGIFSAGSDAPPFSWDDVNMAFLQAVPWVVGIVGIWFIIAYFFNVSMINHATGAKPLERKENMRVYNIVENLCMSVGMDMPKLYVVDDPELNAYASGINKKTYAVTVTTGLLEVLDDRELEGVIAHELTHIRNRDTRVLITSIVFVGIISTVLSFLFNNMVAIAFGSNRSRSSSNGKNNALATIVIIIVAVICLAIAYLFVSMTRFAISRKREFMADAGGAELCGDSLALASALRKISNDPGLKDCMRDDVAQLFIALPAADKEKTTWFSRLFATHPDIHKRIQILEQF